MKPSKMKYRSVTGRVTVELPFDSETDLMEIQQALQREGLTPSREVSKSMAVRRSLKIYARSLKSHPGQLSTEARDAAENTYGKA
jgi:hypothetical protein